MKPILKQAEGLFIVLKQFDQNKPGLPSSISAIIYADRNKLIKDDDDDEDLNLTTTWRSLSENNERATQPKIPVRFFSDSHPANGSKKPLPSSKKTV